MAEELQILQGTLDVMVLKALAANGPAHGYAIARWIRTTTDRELLVEDRALYVALHRLEERGLIDAKWGVSENNRRARFYRLTRPGRKQLAGEAERWRRYARAVGKVLDAEATT